jgi:hypothetical protein
MFDPASGRLRELLQAIIGELERFLSSDPATNRLKPVLLGIGIDLQLAAGYLAAMGLKPDGDWLLKAYDRDVIKTGFALLESDMWANDPEKAQRLGYSRQWFGEQEKVREWRRRHIQITAGLMLESLRRLLEMVSDSGSAPSLSATAEPNVNPEVTNSNTEIRSTEEVLTSKPDLETYAISLLFKSENLTLTDIARQVGVSRQTLYDWPKFLEAAKRAGKYNPKTQNTDSLPKGTKSVDGTLEAWRESDDE